MKTRTWSAKNSSLLVFLILMALPGAALAQPSITTLSFTPATINTTAGPASVVVNFSLTDPGAGITYFETAFVDPFGSTFQRVSKTFSPSSPITDSVTVNFPQFSHSGTWNLAYVFVADAAGATLFLTTSGLAAAGFATALQVTSPVDTTPPNITVFDFTPTSINTTSASATVTVNFTVTDDLSGAKFFQVVFTSPSGNSIQTASKNLTPSTSVTDSVLLTFPKFSESGTWTASVFIADGAGNTLVLATADLAARGFPHTTLVVTTTPDTTPPTLTSFSFTPASLFTVGGTVLVSPVVADNSSGVNRVEVTFVSPSGGQIVTGAAVISPPSTSPSSAASQIQLTFPNPSELGTWTTASIFISDAAGNTTLINQPITFTINPPGADTTPPLIIPTVSPMPNNAGWNNTTPVTVTWSVSDPESGIASSTNCGKTTVGPPPPISTTVTCSAINGAGLTSSASVVVMIDTAAPVTSNVVATPDPVIINTDVTITATVTDTGGSHVASAEFQVDGGPFDDLAGAFGTDNVNVSLTLPGSATPLLQTPGVHNMCVRGTDFASNIGATTCVLFAVYDPNGGFATGGGGANSPAGADLANLSGSGPVTFAFNPHYLPNNSTVPAGDLEFHYNAGNIVFKSTGWDFLVVTNGNRGQAQGTGTINGTSVCKFSLDAWAASFPPNNVDAFGLTIFNCDGGTGNRYVLPTGPITKGSIKVH